MSDNSTLEANKALVRRNFEVIWTQCNLEVADEIIDPHYVGHIAALPDTVRGVETFKQVVMLYHLSAPDIRFEIQDQLAEGDKVATRWIAHGTHQGEFMGIAPSGQRMSVTGMSFHRIENDRIQESWDDWDALNMLRNMSEDIFQSLSMRI
ncbi:MAG TPA: ester cyclase [Candidatus Competibacteraceae bacterium]|nr:ester cyclase [Candidatus Competibacteraceae bacterium]HRZ05012.1 ester cyclase [Candidatus Competibacteraceae bacterium]HSA47581.1 ester cyclase [Candidatus Competibacteraceae bacterium]